MELKKIFAGRKVLVTGHTGFKGSWLTLWLNELGAEVSGYALEPPTHPSLFDEAEVEEICDHYIGDLRDEDCLRNRIEKVQPEIVFHLGAQPIVSEGYKDPKGTFATNVQGLVNLLDTLRHCPSARVCVVVTTDKVYENREWHHAYRECDALGGHDPYSASKACAELITTCYRKSFFTSSANSSLSLSSARAGNVLGGGDWSTHRLLPDCARAVADEREVELRHPNATRPWLHVLDALAGYLMLAAKQWEEPGEYASSWNFAPLQSEHVSVAQVVDGFFKSWGRGKWRNTGKEVGHEATYLSLDGTKTATVLGWKPGATLQKTLADAANWYKGRLENPDFNSRQECLRQIRRYMNADGK